MKATDCMRKAGIATGIATYVSTRTADVDYERCLHKYPSITYRTRRVSDTMCAELANVFACRVLYEPYDRSYMYDVA